MFRIFLILLEPILRLQSVKSILSPQKPHPNKAIRWTATALCWTITFWGITAYLAVIVLLIWGAYLLGEQIVAGSLRAVPVAAMFIWAVLGPVLGFIWNIAIYIVVAYLVIEQFRTAHNLNILRRAVENLQKEKFPEL